MLKKITLSLLLITQSLFCNEDIEKEYPELIPFFQSPKFQASLKNFSTEVIKDRNLLGATRIEIGSDGIKRIIVFSGTIINRKELTPEELKFMICHELGHVNDPRLWITGVIPTIIWIGAASLTTVNLMMHLVKRSKGILPRIGKSAGWLFLGLAAVQYLARQGEYFADEYGLKMTGNLNAAVSILEKRRSWEKGKDENKPSVFKKLFGTILADHPSEEDRIKQLKRIKN
jgi:Zn-dependent protease with chaperone function